MITAVPTATPVTKPFELTFAIDSSDDDQTTSWSAFSGDTVAANCRSNLASTSKAGAWISTLSGAKCLALTSIIKIQFSNSPLDNAQFNPVVPGSKALISHLSSSIERIVAYFSLMIDASTPLLTGLSAGSYFQVITRVSSSNTCTVSFSLY